MSHLVHPVRAETPVDVGKNGSTADLDAHVPEPNNDCFSIGMPLVKLTRVQSVVSVQFVFQCILQARISTWT